MKFFNSFFNKISKLKYLIITLFFLLWMTLIDTHSLIIHNELNNEINSLKSQELKKNIAKDKNIIEVLKNPDSLEVFGRRNYNLKKENETIFYIESEQNFD